MFIDLHDEITLPDGRISRLADVLGPLLDANGNHKDPPPISTKFWDEFSGKQKLLSTFFTKKIDPLISKSGSPESQSSLESPHKPNDTGSSVIPPYLTSPAVSIQLNLPTYEGNVQPSLSGSHGFKRKIVSSSAEASSKKPKKPQVVHSVGKQPKLFSFFSTSTLSQSEIPLQQPSSSPIELIDSGDELNLSQQISDPSPSEKPTALSVSQAKGTTSSKDAWSRLMQPIEPPRCAVHNEPTKELTVSKAGPNRGKKFFICSM